MASLLVIVRLEKSRVNDVYMVCYGVMRSPAVLVSMIAKDGKQDSINVLPPEYQCSVVVPQTLLPSCPDVSPNMAR